jgi:signal transduction histidine kinase
MKNREALRRIYLVCVSTVGVLILAASVLQLPTYEDPLILFLLIALAIAAQFVSTFASTKIIYEVGTAISIAAVPIFGPLGASLVAIVSFTGHWLIYNRTGFPGWRKSLEQLGFNNGMYGLTVFLAGTVFTFVLDSFTPLGPVVVVYLFAWLTAAVIADQVNLWLLAFMVYLQHNLNPKEMWWENRWAIPINVTVTAAGGGALAFAIQELGLVGMFVFFLPVFLSAYSFRIYVNSTKEQMDKLEDLVTLRTAALTEANMKLADLHKDKDAFLAVLTHDMRTPLTSILGYAGLLKDRALADEEKVHISAVILRNGRALLEIVNNILEIEQLQSGTPVLLERENFDLGLLVKNVAESIETQAVEKSIRLECRVAPEPVYLYADKQKLQRVVQNLVSNAVKYTPKTGCVALEVCVENGQALVNVNDTGYGIPTEDLPHIFERFRRVRQHQDKAVGTGLGLAIVKSLVEAHDGQIVVTSEEGVGSTFTIKLPV